MNVNSREELSARSERRRRKGKSFRVTRANARIMAISHPHSSSRALVRRSSGGLRRREGGKTNDKENPNISILMKLHYFASSGGCVGVFNSESSTIPFPQSPFFLGDISSAVWSHSMSSHRGHSNRHCCFVSRWQPQDVSIMIVWLDRHRLFAVGFLSPLSYPTHRSLKIDSWWRLRGWWTAKEDVEMQIQSNLNDNSVKIMLFTVEWNELFPVSPCRDAKIIIIEMYEAEGKTHSDLHNLCKSWNSLSLHSLRCRVCHFRVWVGNLIL